MRRLSSLPRRVRADGSDFARFAAAAASRPMSSLPRRVLADGPDFADFVSGRATSRAAAAAAAEPRPALSRERLDPALLVDRFGRRHTYLRLSLTERCNLRCRYCMPAEGVSDLTPGGELLSAGEIERVASVFARAGATKVRLTGGEPTLRRALARICGAVAALPGVESVGVTTNGINLLRKEGAGALLDNLVDAGLTSVNLSLDSLDATKFAALTRRPGKTLDRVLRAVDACAAHATLKTKVNCVVMRGENDDELAAFARRWAGTGVEVRFIEWMPFQANDWSAGKLVAYDDMLGALRSSLAPGERLYQRDSDAADPHDTTRWWRLGGAKLGFITSMTDHFCGGCNRVRVTADGSLKTCLFGSDSVSLRDVLRGGASDADLAAAVHAALQKKHFRHGGHGGAEDLAKHAGENRHMVRIGG